MTRMMPSWTQKHQNLEALFDKVGCLLEDYLYLQPCYPKMLWYGVNQAMLAYFQTFLNTVNERIVSFPSVSTNHVETQAKPHVKEQL